MFPILRALAIFVSDVFKSRRQLEVENLSLRHQLNVALRQAPRRFRIRDIDRLFLVVVLGEAHLRRILFGYCAYYNEARPHLALQKHSPLGRAVQRVGNIVAIPVLGGLHHQYVRI
jgi:hypothetical protein